MDHEQLMGRLLRLKLELAVACRAQPRQSARVDRITDDLAGTERQLAALRPVDEQCGESMLPFAT